MLIKTLPVGFLQTNCYVVSDPETLDCVIIDPGAESGTILDYVEEHRLQCRAILITHAHFDHTTALEHVMEQVDAPVYIGRYNVGAPSGNRHAFTPPEGTVLCADGDEITAGSLRFRVMETPGHSAGSVVFVCEDCLFTGDTLFFMSCGRTDFADSDPQAMLLSLRRLGELPGDYEVYPGHEHSSTLENERRFNPYMIQALDY